MNKEPLPPCITDDDMDKQWETLIQVQKLDMKIRRLEITRTLSNEDEHALQMRYENQWEILCSKQQAQIELRKDLQLEEIREKRSML